MGDHARVLSKILAAHGDDRDTLAWALRSAEKISSDGDKARVLKEAVSRYSDDEVIRKAFFDAANSISSDGDHQQVLVALRSPARNWCRYTRRNCEVRAADLVRRR
jgi:hypothetical protein